jgi:phosphoribosylformimino-5-aminoimidazole carboxamide ribotide isomerase
MRIIGVVDLAGGLAVHARAGHRAAYTPVGHVNGDALTLARAYVERLGVDEIYVADLDAITAATSPNAIIRSVASLGVPLWLDAGTSSAGGAHTALAAGATRVIVGLETLPSFEALDDICRAIGSNRLALSLDLREGRPVVFSETPIEEIARRAAAAGVAALTVIDLARVGTGAGPDLPIIARVRRAVPAVLLVAGGGVRGPHDLAQLADAGCDGALVATALHDGRLTVRDVAAARALQRSVSR